MRKKRETHKTPLALFLKKLLADERLSIQAASRIAGCAPSTMHGWLQGALPAEIVDKLKALVNHYEYTRFIAEH